MGWISSRVGTRRTVPLNSSLLKSIQSGTTRVGNEGTKHLRHAPANGGGVHVPHRPTGKQAPGTLDAELELIPLLLVEQALEASR